MVLGKIYIQQDSVSFSFNILVQFSLIDRHSTYLEVYIECCMYGSVLKHWKKYILL